MDDTSILLASVGNAQSANLYAYCNNNSVNRVDYTGWNWEDAVRDIIDLAIFWTATKIAVIDNNVLPKNNNLAGNNKYDFLAFSYQIKYSENVANIDLKFKMMTEIGVMYFEASVQYRTTDVWKKRSQKNIFERAVGGVGKALDWADNKLSSLDWLLTPATQVLGGVGAFLVDFPQFAIGISSEIISPNYKKKQKKFVDFELERQKKQYGNDFDGAFILMQYCRYTPTSISKIIHPGWYCIKEKL